MAARDDDVLAKSIPASRVAQLWSWLPAFRVVAETENLRAAAELLHVTPSALSRTIRVLEDNLQLTLFERHGRNLKLNPNGRLLLSRTRDAMRGIDEALQDLFETRFSGELRVSSVGVTTHFVLPALADLRATYPTLRAAHTGVPMPDVVPALTRGRVDVAFHESPVAASELELEKLAEVDSGVFCGRGHPLHSRRAVPLDEVLRHEFVAPPAVEGGPLHDGWPPELPRKVGVSVQSLGHGLDLCEAGRFLALLPVPLARDGMRQLTGPGVPPTSVYVLRRRALSDDDPVASLIALVREALAPWRPADDDASC